MSDKVHKAWLTRDLEHFVKNYGPDSEPARGAAAKLASFEEEAQQRARASKPVGQLLCAAVQEMQATRKRHNARLDAVKAAQEHLAATEAQLVAAQQHLEAETCAC